MKRERGKVPSWILIHVAKIVTTVLQRVNGKLSEYFQGCKKEDMKTT
jgi:hypothetical protein